jgi:hypothetical protein
MMLKSRIENLLMQQAAIRSDVEKAAAWIAMLGYGYRVEIVCKGGKLLTWRRSRGKTGPWVLLLGGARIDV